MIVTDSIYQSSFGCFISTSFTVSAAQVGEAKLGHSKRPGLDSK